MESADHSGGARGTQRVLAVADWSADPEAVISALRRDAAGSPIVFDLLVPARLAALDWIGDPKASRPCAERQLAELVRLASRDGVPVVTESVGDPDRVAAIRALADSLAPDRIVVFERARLMARHPLSVIRRVRRATGSGVERVVLPPATPARRAGRRTRCRVSPGAIAVRA